MSETEDFVIEHLDPRTLLRNPYNYRTHPIRQQEALAGSIAEHGWLAAPIWNRRTGHIVDGHARVSQAIGFGVDRIPVRVIDVSLEAEKRILAQFDRITGLAGQDDESLSRLLIELSESDLGLPPGWSDDELDELLSSLAQTEDAGLSPEPGQGGDEFETEGAAMVEAVAQTGDLWAMGPHRLLVGDCTIAADVDRLFGSSRAAIGFTSPPYNAGKSARLSKNCADPKFMMSDTKYVLGDADDLDEDEYFNMLCDFTHNAIQHCQYLFVNLQQLAANKIAFLEYLFSYRHHFVDRLIWDKGYGVPVLAPNVLNNQFEDILIFADELNPTRAIKTAEFRGTVSNVHQGPPQCGNEFFRVHAATFPLHLPTFIIENFTQKGQIVYDAFLGTGVTMVAAHRLGRICYGIEIVPAYADIVIARWLAETGEEAVKL